MKDSLSVRTTLWANRIIGAAVAVLLFTMPAILRWYAALRPLPPSASLAILLAFYGCVLAVAPALWDIDRILKRILAGQVFIHANVRCVRRIRWYCVAVCLICFPAAFFYPPLVFMVVIMAFLSLIVSVVASILAAAVSIREENDLTI